jgi:hypothetical protein
VHLQALVNDGFRFVRYFGMAMAKSAPHIYVSALPFAPSSSLIAAQYSQMFPHILSMQHGKALHWPALEMMVEVGKVFSLLHAHQMDNTLFQVLTIKFVSGILQQEK